MAIAVLLPALRATVHKHRLLQLALLFSVFCALQPAEAAKMERLSPAECAKAFKNLEFLQTWRRENLQPDPTQHLANLDETLQLFMRSKEPIAVKHVVLSEHASLLCYGNHSCFFVMDVWETRSRPGFLNFEVRDARGKRFTLRAQEQEGSLVNSRFASTSTFDIAPKSWKAIRGQANSIPVDLKALKAEYSHQGTEKMSAGELGTYLSRRQLATSTTAVESGSSEFVVGIKEANLMLAKALKENAPINKETLEKLNLLASKGIHPYGDPALEPLAGTLRGTKSQVISIDGRKFVVDTTEENVAQAHMGVVELNSFPPAKDVPAAIAAWLERANSISPSSDPREVFTLYQEFIFIHPFADANGRTGRMLLNYMLLKAELPSMTRASDSFYFSADDMVESYLEDVLP